MLLSEYLQSENKAQFAKAAGVSRTYLYLLMDRESEPLVSKALKISDLTGGAVTVQEMAIDYKPEKPLPRKPNKRGG